MMRLEYHPEHKERYQARERLIDLGLDEKFAGQVEAGNPNALDLQIDELAQTVEMLEAQAGFDREQLAQFVKLANGVMDAYKYTKRTKGEQIKPGIPAPVLVHFMKSIQLVCQTFDLLTRPGRYRTLYKEYGVTVSKIQGDPQVSRFVESFAREKFVIVCALLFHDIAEDGKYIMPGDLDLLQQEGSEAVDQSQRELFAEKLFVGDLKGCQIDQDEAALFSHELQKCDVDQLIDIYIDYHPDQRDRTEYCKEQLEQSGLFDELKAYQALDRKVSQSGGDLLLQHYKTDQNIHTDQMQLAQRNVVIQMSLYNVFKQLVSVGVDFATALQIVGDDDTLTYRKYGEIDLTGKHDLAQAMIRSPRIAREKYGDSGHNLTSITKLLNASGKKHQGKLPKKYEEYTKVIYAAGSFFPYLYPMALQQLGLPLDELMAAKIEASQRRLNQIMTPYQTSDEPVLPGIDRHPYRRDADQRLINEMTMRTVINLNVTTPTPLGATIDEQLADELQELRTKNQHLAVGDQWYQMSTVLDLFNASGLYGHERGALDQLSAPELKQLDKEGKQVDLEHVTVVLEAFLGEDLTQTDSALGFEISPQGVDRLNTIFNNALVYRQDVLRLAPPKAVLRISKYFTRHKQLGDKRINLNNTLRVVQFVSEAARHPDQTFRQFVCDILKLSYAEALFEKSELIKDHDQKFAHLIVEKFLPLFAGPTATESALDTVGYSILEAEEKLPDIDNKESFFIDKLEQIEKLTTQGVMTTKAKKALGYNRQYTANSQREAAIPDPTEIRIDNIYFRAKTGKSVRLKLFCNPNYDHIEAIKDLLGIKIEVATVKDALLLLNYLYYTFFDQQVEKIKVKGLFSLEDIETYRASLGRSFYQKMKVALRRPHAKKQRSHSKYQDAKLIGQIGGADIPAIELQVVLRENENENDYSTHAVLNGAKIIESVVRLHGYVTADYVQRIAEYQVMEHPELVRLSPDRTIIGAARQLIDYYQQTCLLPVRIVYKRGRHKHLPDYYTTPDRRSTLKASHLLHTDSGASLEVYYQSRWRRTTLPGWEYKQYRSRLDELFDELYEFQFDPDYQVSEEMLRLIDEKEKEVYALLVNYASLSKQDAKQQRPALRDAVRGQIDELLSYASEQAGIIARDAV